MWVPLIVVNETLVSWVLQRLSDVHVSPASNDEKMNEAQHVMDDMATRFLEPDSRNKSVSKMQLGKKQLYAERTWLFCFL